jgi:hypothetical protein
LLAKKYDKQGKKLKARNIGRRNLGHKKSREWRFEIYWPDSFWPISFQLDFKPLSSLLPSRRK